MMISDPWGLLLNQRGGGSIDMSRGFSGFGNLPSLDWMPNPGVEHGVDVRGQFSWNVADSYTYFNWYESLKFARAREENRRLLLGGFAKTTRMLLADNSGEIQLDTSAPPTRAVFVGYIEKDGILHERYIINGQVEDIRVNLTEDVTVVASREDSVSTVAGQGATGAPIPAPDWTTQTEWRFPAADPRLIQPITSVDTGNRSINFVVNKVLLPWRNALAFAENFPLAALMGIDDAAKRSAFSVEYQASQDMMPLAPAMGLAMEAGPALAYAKAWMSTSQRLRNAARGLGAVARVPTYVFMGAAGDIGAGEGVLPTLGPVLESALPSTELPSVAVDAGRKSPFGSYTITFESKKGYGGMGGPERMKASAKRIMEAYRDRSVKFDWTPAESKMHQRFDEALRIFEEGGAGSKLNYNKIHTGISVDPELYNDFVEFILRSRE